MNPRQRRGVLLMAVATIGAAGVFFGVYRYVSDVRSQIGDTVQVLRLTSAVAAFNTVPQGALEVTEVPERWAPERRLQDVEGLVAVTNLPAGAILQEGMVTDRPEIQPGEREIAIIVNDESAVAGKIRPNDRVDVYATFPGAEGVPPSSRVVLQNIRVVAVGNPVTTPDPNAAFAEQPAVPITFALVPDQAQILTYAEQFASSVRLALRTPNSDPEDVLPDSATVYAPLPPRVTTDHGGDE